MAKILVFLLIAVVFVTFLAQDVSAKRRKEGRPVRAPRANQPPGEEDNKEKKPSKIKAPQSMTPEEKRKTREERKKKREEALKNRPPKVLTCDQLKTRIKQTESSLNNKKKNSEGRMKHLQDRLEKFREQLKAQNCTEETQKNDL